VCARGSNCPPMRGPSTSSLGDRVGTVISVLWSIFFVAFFTISVARHLSLRELIGRLKELDMLQWETLGCPEVTFFRRFSDYVETTPAASRPGTLASQYTDLSLWLSTRQYEHFKDATITRAADHYRVLGSAQLAVGALVICAFLYSHFFTPKLIP
jgi:hypothetical protein